MIVVASSDSGGSVASYDLPVPHDPVSAVPRNGSVVIPPEYGVPTSIAVSPDGTKMFVTTEAAPGGVTATAYAAPAPPPPLHPALFGYAADRAPAPLHFPAPRPASSHDAMQAYILEYDLSSPFDVSTASLSASSPPARLSSSQFSSPAGTAFSGDGTLMYVALSSPAGGGFVHSYALSPPFDVSSRAPAAALPVSSLYGAISDVAVSGDGSVLLVTAHAAGPAGGGFVLSYALSTPFDLSSAPGSPSGSVPIPSARGSPVGAAFFGDGSSSSGSRTVLVAATVTSSPSIPTDPASAPSVVSLPVPTDMMAPTTPPPTTTPGAPRVCR